MYCYYDGMIMKESDVSISPMSHGFLYGVGFFETFRTYNGEIFQLDAHFERLTRALTDLNMACSLTPEQLRVACHQLNELNGNHDGYFRLNVYAGEEGLGLAAPQYDSVHVLLLRKPLHVSRGTEKNAYRIEVPRNSEETTYRHKSFNFLNNVKARQQLNSLATEEGILINREGYVVEGVTSNVFWSKGNVIYTPSVTTGLLEGTARSTVLKIASRHYEVCIGEFKEEDLHSIDEMWITNAVQELVPIKSYENKRLLGNEGPIYQHLHVLYQQVVYKGENEK